MAILKTDLILRIDPEMSLYAVPWLELALIAPVLGSVLAARCRDPRSAWRIAFSSSAATFACAALASIGHVGQIAPGGLSHNDVIYRILGGRVVGLDDVNAALVPFVALIHLVIIAGTTGGKATHLSFGGLLALEAVHVATFAAIHLQVLAALLALGTVVPFLELSSRGQSTRLYSIHLGLFVSLLAIGMGVGLRDGFATPLAWIPLALAILMRCGIVPFQLWVGDLFARGTFGTAVLVVTPMTGVLAAVRLLVPFCPAATLEVVSMLGTATALYAAGLAVVQMQARRFVACLCVGNTAMVLTGISLSSEIAVTAALGLWVSVGIALTGAAFALRAAESRIGAIALVEFRGLYDRAPALAVCFLFAGLATVGFPGTLGFLPLEALVEHATTASPLPGVGIAVTIALNGFAILRVYALVFTGRPHDSPIPLGVTLRERFTVLALALLVLGGGLVPQTLFDLQQRAARSLIEDRALHSSDSMLPLPPNPER
jgi:NADH-quinone oxidoreductase subunit M